MSSFVGVLGRLKGVGSLLGFTALTLAVSAAIEYGRNLLFAKSAAEELEEALAEAVKAADFSSAEGVDAFIAQLREMQLEADLSAEQISKALSVRLAKIGADELAELRDRLVDAFEAGGQASKELEAALAAVDARLADIEKRANWGRALATEAEAAHFALSDLQKQFQAVGTEAEAVGGALKKMLADADLGSLDGIEKLAADLKVVQDSAYATGEQIDGALRERLASLTANELREFGIMAEMAFNQGKLGAEEMARINDQVLAASFDKLGVNAATALGKISPAAQEAIVAVDNVVKGLAQAGVEAGQAGIAIEMALTKAFAGADTKEALGELIDRMEALDKAGKIGAEAFGRLANAAAEALTRIEDLTPGIQSVEEAFRRLGIKSSDELKFLAAEAKQAFNVIRESGKATPAELKAAFTAYAEAAIEANGGVVDALLQQEAGQVGLRVEADKTGKVIVKTFAEVATEAAKVTDETKKAAGGIKEMGSAADDAGESLMGARNSVADAVETTKGASVAWLSAADASNQFAAGAKEAGDRAYQAALAMGNAGGSIESWTRYLGSAITAAQGAARGYINMMESLERQQAELTSSGASGLEDLKFRWLELNGTEEQIAQARQARDEANVQRQIALLQIEVKRAQLNSDGALAKQLKAEIALMKEQLVWIAKIAVAEERQRKAREREAEKEEERRERERREAERNRNNSSDDSDSDSSPTPSRPSSNAGGSSPNIGGSNNNTPPTRPVPPTGPIVNVHIGGVLDVQDHATLDSLARKLRPVFANLDRKGF